MYTNLTNTQANKLPKDLQKKCIKLINGTWDIKTTYLPENLKGKPIAKDSSKERTGFSPEKATNNYTEQDEKRVGARGASSYNPKRNMGAKPDYKNKKEIPAKKLGFF